MIGKYIKRTEYLSIILIIFFIIQNASFGELIIHSGSEDSSWNVMTEMDLNTELLDELNMNAEEAESKFHVPKMNIGYFTENLGQWKGHIRFLAHCLFGYIALGDDGVYYYTAQEKKGHGIKITFQDAKSIHPVAREDMGFESNFFFGNDPYNWVTNVRSYKEVLYKEIWPGIDILYYFKNGNLKYDIMVGEHSDPGIISFNIEGHSNIDIREKSVEIFISKEISISDTDLVAFYEDGSTVPIQFKKTSDHNYGFDVKKIDGKTLTIDPIVFSTSTFLGGSGWEDAKDIAIDTGNNIIVLGETTSNDFPNTTGAYQNDNHGAGDIFVTKLDENTSTLIFSTYIGGWGGDIPGGMEIDDNGDIFIAGQTWATDFPTTPGTFQESDPSGTYPDVFVLKLSAQGSDLLYSTYVGGSGSDSAYDIKIRDGNAYVVGNTLSYDFPTAGPPVGDPHGTVLFFMLSNDGSTLLNSAFFGGWSNDFGYSLDIDKNNDVVIGGVTFSLDFPTTPGAYKTSTNDTSNGFVLKYRPSSNSTIFSTYAGGDAGDNVAEVYVDDGTDIYFAGWTTRPGGGSAPYPTTPGAFDRTINGNRDLFITKMDPNGTILLYSTFIGGDSDNEEVGSLCVDGKGNVYFTGFIDSEVNFTLTSDCYDGSYNGDGDAFVLILDNIGSNLVYSTFLGGTALDSGEACALSNSDDILVLGNTASLDFPVTGGSFQIENKGSYDIFITRFNIGNKMNLLKGWNFISVPLIQSNTNLASVLISIDGYYDAVQWYNKNDISDFWKHYNTAKSSQLNDLKNLDHTRGFWIHIPEPSGVLFEYPGTKPTSNQIIQLYPGWNMVGYPSLTNHNRTVGLNNLIFGVDVDTIQWCDAATQTWHFMDLDDSFVQGRGYWVHSNVEAIWEVPL